MLTLMYVLIAIGWGMELGTTDGKPIASICRGFLWPVDVGIYICREIG